MKINIDRLIDVTREANEAYREYAEASAIYRKNHYGLGVNIDRATTPEEKKIAYLCKWSDAEQNKYFGVCEVLNLSGAQRIRLNTMARAFEKWYNRTSWERCPNEDMLNRAYRFIAQEG